MWDEEHINDSASTGLLNDISDLYNEYIRTRLTPEHQMSDSIESSKACIISLTDAVARRTSQMLNWMPKAQGRNRSKALNDINLDLHHNN